MIKFFYDLLVFLTKNYSSMSDDFKKLFPEERLVKIALHAFTNALTSKASGQTTTRFKQALFAVLQSKFI